LLKADVLAALQGSPDDHAEQDALRYAVQVSVWARWAMVVVSALLLAYRPDFWYPEQPERVVLLIALVAVNGLTHSRLLLHQPVTRTWMLLLSGADVALLSAAIAVGAGFDRFIFAAYYPALAMFVLIFPSLWLALAWTSLTAASCTAATLLAAGGLDFDARDEHALLGRVAAMYVLVLCVLLITRLERARKGLPPSDH